MNNKRIERLTESLTAHGLDGAIAIPGPTLYYLTGHKFHLMERPVILFVSTDREPLIVLPELEISRVDDTRTNLQIISYAEDDASRRAALGKACSHIGAAPREMAVEPLSLRFFEFDLLRTAAPRWSFQSGDALFTELRARKDESELKSIRNAVEVAESALHAALPLIKTGMTERELAAELVVQLLRAGSDAELPFQPIVASGPNSALPHATPTDRELAPGDLLIIDWGARMDGYVSDITRTYAIGDPDPEHERIHQVVAEANAAGRMAIQPGAACELIDQAARQVIEAAGHGQQFIHRTGHGIGLEAHEPPNIRAGETTTLQAGMTFTVEPGIYFNGNAGVRIEDNVVVTEQGVETLTTLPRSLDVVA